MMIVTYCVQHFNELWEIVQPARCCHLEDNMTYTDEISHMCKSVITSWDVRATYPQSLRWFRVVDQVTAKWISSPPSWHYELREWENSWIKSLNDHVDNLIRTLIIAIDKTFRIQITMNACLSNSWGREKKKKSSVDWDSLHRSCRPREPLHWSCRGWGLLSGPKVCGSPLSEAQAMSQSKCMSRWWSFVEVEMT